MNALPPQAMIADMLSALPVWAKFILGYVVAFVVVAFLGQTSNAALSAKDFSWQFRLVALLRTPIIMFVVVPLSFAKWAHRAWIRDPLRRLWRKTNATSHDDRCRLVVNQILEWNRRGRPKKLRTARPNWASMSTKLSSNKTSCETIDTGHLNHILEIDDSPDKLQIVCEPGVTMGQITQELLPRNLALKCQVEMESLTIGGLSLGFGLETNSHTVGFFQETILEYKICTSTGDIVTCTATGPNKDLFFALPWSHGSLGFLLSVTVQLIRIQPYVKITYVPTYSAQALQELLQFYTTNDDDNQGGPDFVEATAYTKDHAVVQLGEFVSPDYVAQHKSRVNGINHFWKPFYYKWVETFLTKGKDWEIVPTKHFYHRFTRSIFWELEDMIPFSNHPLYRLLWGWMGAPEVSLLKLFQGPVIRQNSVKAHVVQESIMPIAHVSDGLAKFDSWFGVYPLLIFCIRVYQHEPSGFLTPRPEHLIHGKNWGIWVDIGAYGVPRNIQQGKPWTAKTAIRAMEEWTRHIGGWQATYTDLFCTRREFRQMFNHALYDQQRIKYQAVDAFPEVYDKVKPEDGIVDLTAEELAEEQQQEAEQHQQRLKSE